MEITGLCSGAGKLLIFDFSHKQCFRTENYTWMNGIIPLTDHGTLFIDGKIAKNQRRTKAIVPET